MDKSLSSLVSLWPVVLGAIIAGYLLAYMIEPKPFVSHDSPLHSTSADRNPSIANVVMTRLLVPSLVFVTLHVAIIVMVLAIIVSN